MHNQTLEIGTLGLLANPIVKVVNFVCFVLGLIGMLDAEGM
jgi:hypothetical protein